MPNFEESPWGTQRGKKLPYDSEQEESCLGSHLIMEDFTSDFTHRLLFSDPKHSIPTDENDNFSDGDILKKCQWTISQLYKKNSIEEILGYMNKPILKDANHKQLLEILDKVGFI